ncbi:MAG TPA: RecQ family ATP-dependent DNA helicase [Acidimicrobiales bacterium]|nr:RecQ family ATP-dependent DNA helicase [Acidimicrobiales bacterium]
MPLASLTDAATDLLRKLTGRSDASFRDGQLEAISALVSDRRRVLVVQRTGWGKSAVYFVATRLLRDAGAGPTILISPLLALMRNQIAAAERAGVMAATINSDNTDDWSSIEADVRAGRVDLLLISPERLNNVRFRRDVLPALVRSVGMVVVDEAHCISDWGHDFRPDYRRIARVLEALPVEVPVLCTTATANDRVVVDIVSQLGSDLAVVRGPLDRESLALSVVDLPQPASRLAWLAQVVPTLPGSGIVYCLTIHDAERVTEWLTRCGVSALAYSGESEGGDRLRAEAALLANEVKVLVATSALGMGFDKPDLGFVVHYQSPGSAIAYYQQVGRAGRALATARGVLLRGNEDRDIQDHFIRVAFPPQDQAEAVMALLASKPGGGPVTMTEIESTVNARRMRIEAMLKVLEVEGAIERGEKGWFRTQQAWAYDAARVETVTRLRREEQAAMVGYATTDGCRMAFLRAQLDDVGGAGDERGGLAPCGRCDNCTGESSEFEPDPASVASAVQFLRASRLELEPRRQWPAGIDEAKGRIPKDEQLRVGRALGLLGDGGWGSVVAGVLRTGDAEVPDEVLDAAASLVRAWAPAGAAPVITWVPSTARPVLVESLARRLGEALGWEAAALVRRVRPMPPQSDMANSAQQVRNVFRAFGIVEPPPGRPVLLVDDVAESRWTLTIIGGRLIRAGSGDVYPFVLAKSGGG